VDGDGAGDGEGPCRRGPEVAVNLAVIQHWLLRGNGNTKAPLTPLDCLPCRPNGRDIENIRTVEGPGQGALMRAVHFWTTYEWLSNYTLIFCVLTMYVDGRGFSQMLSACFDWFVAAQTDRDYGPLNMGADSERSSIFQGIGVILGARIMCNLMCIIFLRGVTGIYYG